MNFFHERKLSEAAAELIKFDMDSILQVVAAQHLAEPDVWLADPDAYERNGRILRDSESARMLAYSKTDTVLYATDGCNSCARRLRMNLELLPQNERREFAEDNGLRLELLERLVVVIENDSL